MGRIKVILFLLTTASLYSCSKSYECTCIYEPGASSGEVAGITKEVKGRNRAQAEAKCNRMGDPTMNSCVLK